MPREDGTRGLIALTDVDSDALKVVRKLLAAGHEAYLVGGCVRDLYIGARPNDFDVATSATPEAIRKTFRNSRIIGRRFKLAHVFFGPKIIETATFRSPPLANDKDPLITADNEWGSIEEDARRRDFTVNGLFFDVQSQRIVDFVDGMDDLDARLIRTIGEPELRFREDPVRMLRAIRFAAKLDFRVEDRTWESLTDAAADIRKCSQARILEEVYKLLRSGSAHRSFELALEGGVLEHLLPVYLEGFGDQGLQAAATVPAESDPAATASASPSPSPSESLWAHLGALDSYVRGTRQQMGNGVLLAVMFAPLLADSLLADTRQQLDQVIDKAMTPTAAAMGMARRDRELAKQILMATSSMMDPSRKRRRSSLVQRQYFHDALSFLGISVHAHGIDGSELAYWKTLAEAHRGATRIARDEPPRKRSRSRRRRGKPKGSNRGSNTGTSPEQ